LSNKLSAANGDRLLPAESAGDQPAEWGTQNSSGANRGLLIA